MDASNLTKRSVLERLLQDSMVLITLDGRHAEVDVPDNLREDPQLRLNLSYRFGRPMDIDDWGVHATLKFGGVPYDCNIPWEAIYVVVSHSTGQPFVFPTDIPADLRVDAKLAEDAASPLESETAPTLRVIPGASEPAPSAAETEEEIQEDVSDEPTEDAPAKATRSRAHLRVVK